MIDGPCFFLSSSRFLFRRGGQANTFFGDQRVVTDHVPTAADHQGWLVLRFPSSTSSASAIRGEDGAREEAPRKPVGSLMSFSSSTGLPFASHSCRANTSARRVMTVSFSSRRLRLGTHSSASRLPSGGDSLIGSSLGLPLALDDGAE